MINKKKNTLNQILKLHLFPILPMIMSLYYMFKYKPYVVTYTPYINIQSYPLCYFFLEYYFNSLGTDFINHKDNFFIRYFFKFILKK